MAKQDWILKTVFDEYVCDQCGENIFPVWKLDYEFRKKRIRRLNDQMRRGHFQHGSVVLTARVQALDEELLQVVIERVAAFDAFSKDNDPHEEHDFGSFEVAGETFFWKIDYFDLKLERHSPDPANPEITHRVLTIMYASEY